MEIELRKIEIERWDQNEYRFSESSKELKQQQTIQSSKYIDMGLSDHVARREKIDLEKEEGDEPRRSKK